MMIERPWVLYAREYYGSGSGQLMRKGAGTVYRIEVCGEKSRKYAPTFEAMEIETEGGRTVLTGEVVDRPTFTASSTG